MRVLVKQEPVLGTKLKNILSEMNFEIVLNQARTRQEIDMGFALQSVCNKYFGFPCEFLGGLEYDNAVWQSLRQRHHLLMANRQTHLYAQLMSMARKIAKPRQLKSCGITAVRNELIDERALRRPNVLRILGGHARRPAPLKFTTLTNAHAKPIHLRVRLFTVCLLRKRRKN